ncbi:MAG: GNAT family N-acetyltransferase [Pseudomonadota bacterium]
MAMGIHLENGRDSNAADCEYSSAIRIKPALHPSTRYLSCVTMTASPTARPQNSAERLVYKIAAQPEFSAIHRLNYETFVEEIPQHAPNTGRLLIDRFHAQNTYVVCLADTRLVGMVSGRSERPFSLDQKLANLDRCLPPHRNALEIRLLAVRREYRKTSVFIGLMRFLSTHFMERGCDLAVISGTVRQLKLYRHLGFEAFGDRVGAADATYQPMYLTLDEFCRRSASWRGSATSP